MAYTGTTGVTSSNLSALLKYKYEAMLWDELQKESFLWSMIGEGNAGQGLSRQWDGSGYRTIQKVRTGRSFGLEFGASTQTAYPLSLESKYVERYWGNKYHYGTIRVQDMLAAMAEGAGSSGLEAGASLIDTEMKAFREKMSEVFNLFTYGDATGTIATVVSVSGTTGAVVTVDSTRHLEPGMVVDFVRSGTVVTNGVDIEITSVTSATTFVADIAGAPTTADIIVLTNSYGLAFDGMSTFEAITGTYGGVNIANYYMFQPSVFHNGAGGGTTTTFSPKKFMNFIEHVEKRGKNAKSDFLLAHTSVANAARLVMMPNIRFQPMDKFPLYPNVDQIQLEGRTIAVDKDCNKNKIYYLKLADLAKMVLVEPHWKEVNGGIFHLPVDQSTGRHSPGLVAYWEGAVNLILTRALGFGYMDEIMGASDSDETYGQFGGIQ